MRCGRRALGQDAGGEVAAKHGDLGVGFGRGLGDGQAAEPGTEEGVRLLLGVKNAGVSGEEGEGVHSAAGEVTTEGKGEWEDVGAVFGMFGGGSVGQGLVSGGGLVLGSAGVDNCDVEEVGGRVEWAAGGDVHDGVMLGAVG